MKDNVKYISRIYIVTHDIWNDKTTLEIATIIKETPKTIRLSASKGTSYLFHKYALPMAWLRNDVLVGNNADDCKAEWNREFNDRISTKKDDIVELNKYFIK